MRYEVVIVGAGPGGSSAAYHLAREGVDVLLLEKSSFPRKKVCGEGLTPRATRELYRIGLEEKLSGKYHRLNGVGIYGPYRRGVEGPFPPTPNFPDHGYMIAREELDQLLAEQAQSAGAKFLTDHRVTEPIVEDEKVVGVRAVHDDQMIEVEAEVVIGADGARSTLGESLGLLVQDNRYLAVSVRQYFEGVDVDEDLIRIYPEDKILPGSGWIFPLGEGRANVGVGATNYHITRRRINLKDLFSFFVNESKHASAKLKGATPVGPLEGGLLRVGLGGSRVEYPGLLLVGDAASMANPVSGEGITYALESGQMAAELIMENRASSGRIFHDPKKDSFQKRLTDRYGHYFELGMKSVRWGTHNSFMVPLLFATYHKKSARDWLIRAVLYMRH